MNDDTHTKNNEPANYNFKPMEKPELTFDDAARIVKEKYKAAFEYLKNN